MDASVLCLSTASCGHTLTTCPAANPTASSLSTSNVDMLAKEPVGTKQSTTRQTKAPSKELKNQIALQRIWLSQIRDRMNPTVSNQGIVFNEDNNPWSLPPGSNTGPVMETEGRISHIVIVEMDATRGDPGDDGSDSSNDEGSRKGIRDPFTPHFQSRIPSLTPTVRLLEVKAQHTEWKFQQIIEFICQHLEYKLLIPNGAKGTQR
ncbi:hypothetical protein ARMGADRAFT_1035554 [Armillaria gallica]|uniref:Uncharacterized protein n=1 Tax=Armillaria gallica TaxID=47427 RepID=A0A2H3D6D5_ARMGA|nr:hypothetical protein ARMGADRAFT_1035554 [Armillaria gallica]